VRGEKLVPAAGIEPATP